MERIEKSDDHRSISEKPSERIPGSVNFTDESTGPGLTYLWNFGDGKTSTAQNPAHAYTANGKYSVSLAITDQYGCKDQVSKTNYIVITSPVANFKISDSFSTCPPLLVQFTDQSTNAISRNWDFGDSTSATVANPSHFYTYPGTYTAKLTVTSTSGCTDVMKKTIVVEGPTGSFTYQPVDGCKPLSVNFTAINNGKVYYVWDFNDGNTTTTTDSIIAHTYINPGAYIPKVILINPQGCQVAVKGKDTIFVSGIKANFDFVNKPLCDSGFISFSDSSISNDIITGYKWNFGDGNTSAQKNPVYHYTTKGLYYASLITTTRAGCIDSFTTSTAIKIVASPKINMLASANGCAPLTVNFSGVVAVADTSSLTWKWLFGNGNTSVLQTPPAQVYNVSGVYTIDLLATNSSGCTDTVSKNIEAYIIPTVDAGPAANLCKGSSMTLNATGADSYGWTPATALNCTNCQSPATATASTITYTVKGTTIHGCSAVDSVKITVKDPFIMKVTPSGPVCKGDPKKLTASGANTYDWTPSAGLDNPVSASPTALPDTTTNYRVVGTDELGCFKDTGYVLITVNPVPTVDAGPDKTVNSGLPADLIPVISPDVTEVYWSPTNGQFRNIYPGITVKPSENTEYTVEVNNRSGCRARDKVTVYVICNNGNVFIPNTFSPNGDGANDIFYPRGTGLFKVKALRIYNRWGQLVFQRESFDANDPTAGWDGTLKGTKLNADVFVYSIDIICSNKTVLTFKGNVALLQ